MLRDVLKPDLITPGQDILAGVAPPGNGGRPFDLYSDLCSGLAPATRYMDSVTYSGATGSIQLSAPKKRLCLLPRRRLTRCYCAVEAPAARGLPGTTAARG